MKIKTIYMPQPRNIHMAFMCELCNFETISLFEMKQHLTKTEHRAKELKEHEDSLSWFCYFGHVSDHVCIEDAKKIKNARK